MPSPNPLIPLTELQQQALQGSLLGDGNLSLNGKNALYRVRRCLTDIDYLKYEVSLFKNLLASSFQERLVKTYSYLDKRTKKEYFSCYFATQSNPIFTQYYHQWYQNKKKVIPSNLVLSATTIAHWIADDGFLSLPKNSFRFRLVLSTDSFSLEEVEFLCALLSDRYNEKFYSVKKRKTHVIVAHDSACRVLILDINSYFKLDRKRLWDDPKTRFWINPPPKSINTKDNFQFKIKLFEQEISNNVLIKISDLAKKLNYWVHSKNEPNYQALNKLLKPYLDAKLIEKIKIKNFLFLIKVK